MLHAYQRYQQQNSMTRIDLILTLYDEVLAKLAQASGLLATNPLEARRKLHQCQIAVAGMAVDNPGADEVAANLKRLHQFVVERLAEGSESSIEDAVKILTTLREGYEAIRSQAVELERAGQIPVLGSASVQTVA